MKIVNDANFKEEVLDASTPVLVDFYADWCGPCKAMGPIVEKLGEELSGSAKVVKVNVTDSPELSDKYNVESIPTFIVFQNGSPVKQRIGRMSKEELAGLLQ